MSTPVGHSITGAGLAYLFGVNPILGILVANFPDFLGHGDNYKWGHSVFVEAIIGIVFCLTLKSYAWMIIFLSHIFLDCCYQPGVGLACLWPFSDRPVSLARILLLMDSNQPFGEQSLKAYGREILILGSLFMALCLIKRG